MTERTVACLRCHTPLPENSKFCSACGTDQSGGGPTSTTTAAALTLQMQRVVEGRYRIQRVLGKGGMGTLSGT